MECSHSFDVNAPADLVWRYLSDPTTWPSWMETVASVEPIKDTLEPEPGAVYELRRSGDFAGQCRITELEPLQRMAYRLSGTSTPVTGSFSLAPTDGRVRVTSVLETGPVSAAVLSIFAGGRTKVEDQLSDDGRALRRLVEKPL